MSADVYPPSPPLLNLVGWSSPDALRSKAFLAEEQDVDAAEDVGGPNKGAAAHDRGGRGGSSDGDSSDGGGEQEASDPETVFKREVSETFLRCVKERFGETNAVIELNGLKIAEVRSFADCARYMFTTLLGLCLPASPFFARSEYAALFPDKMPDMSTQVSTEGGEVQRGGRCFGRSSSGRED